MPNSTHRGFFLLSCSRLKVYVVNSQLCFYIKRKEFSCKNEQLRIRFFYAKRGAENLKRPLKNGADNNSLPFQDHFCLKKGNYRG